MTKNTQTRRIEFSSSFNKQLKAAPREIKVAFLETLQLFREEPDHALLRNHTLKEKFTGHRSIDITEDWRAVFKESLSGARKVVTFHLLGTHKELYG